MIKLITAISNVSHFTPGLHIFGTDTHCSVV